MPDAVIFDLDGLLLESEQVWNAAKRQLTEEGGGTWSDEAVRGLAERWRLGLASSSNREIIELVLERTGWAELFRVAVSSEEVERGKPAPDVYLEASRRLGAAPDRCVAIEDSSAGIRSAHAAGASVVAIPNRAYPPERDDLELADVVLDRLGELDARVVDQASP